MLAARPLLSIVGPTATGKTGLAFAVAAQLEQPVDILSADSRQVYKGMEVATGVDLPANFSQQDKDSIWHSADQKIQVFGLGVIRPTQAWSAYEFVQLAHGVLQTAWQRQHFPILVGGTGLYHQLLWTPKHFHEDLFTGFAGMKPIQEVRQRAELLDVSELQRWALESDAQRFSQLNHSDRSNPRRLIRVIEKALWEQKTTVKNGALKTELAPLEKPIEQLTIGLTAPIDFLTAAITNRVVQRLNNHVLTETEKLIANFSDEEWRSPAFSATGYKELRAYLEGQLELDQAKQRWIRREVQYAKRQLTWWKKYSQAEWFDVSQADGLQKAQAKIGDWIRTCTSAQK